MDLVPVLFFFHTRTLALCFSMSTYGMLEDDADRRLRGVNELMQFFKDGGFTAKELKNPSHKKVKSDRMKRCQQKKKRRTKTKKRQKGGGGVLKPEYQWKYYVGSNGTSEQPITPKNMLPVKSNVWKGSVREEPTRACHCHYYCHSKTQTSVTSQTWAVGEGFDHLR